MIALHALAAPPLVALASLGGAAPSPEAAPPASPTPIVAPAPDRPSPAPRASDDDPFQRLFALGAYGTGWAGSYAGAGVGGRVRVEPWARLGVDLFGEALVVQTPHGLRHDHPFGFNLYTPIALGGGFRLRPLIGMCFVASFIEPEQKSAPRADDLLVGAHAGVGLERALGPVFSLFAEAQGSVWLGHDRAVQGWTGAVGNDMRPFRVAQAMLGVSAHFGAR